MMTKAERSLKVFLVKALKELRKEKELTQQELADLSGVGVGTISNMENFNRLPKVGTFGKLTHSLTWLDLSEKKRRLYPID